MLPSHTATTTGDEPPALQTDVLADLTPGGLSSPVEQAVKAFLYLFLSLSNRCCAWRALDVTIESQFPAGAGLGSSAAFSVSLTAALMRAVTGATGDNKTVSLWAFRCEHIFHGKPSGIDNSICSFGGAILFQSGHVIDVISNVKKLPALLVYTNVTRNTKLLVEAVTRRKERVSCQQRRRPLITVSLSAVSKCLLRHHGCHRWHQWRGMEPDESGSVRRQRQEGE